MFDDADPGFPDRFLSGRDVDASAGDRADALSDERHAREDRRCSREDRQHADADLAVATEAADVASTEATALRGAIAGRTVIGQAQGLLMARLSISADEAFQWLVGQSQAHNIKLRDVASALVEQADSPSTQQRDDGRR